MTKKWGVEFGSLLWRHLTPHRKTANTIPHVHKIPKDIVENLLPV